jgi:hypothetical protein
LLKELKIPGMNKSIFSLATVLFLLLASCNNSSSTNVQKDSVTNAGPDSAANNGILPPSAAPGNAGNSSLADTTYKAKDSTKK